jgi:hypothetical protein
MFILDACEKKNFEEKRISKDEKGGFGVMRSK